MPVSGMAYFNVVCSIDLVLALWLILVTTYVSSRALKFELGSNMKTESLNVEVMLRLLAPMSVFASTIAMMFGDSHSFVKKYRYLHFINGMSLAFFAAVFYFKYINIVTLAIYKLKGELFTFYKIDYLFMLKDDNNPSMASLIRTIGFLCYVILLTGVCFFYNGLKLWWEDEQESAGVKDEEVELEENVEKETNPVHETRA